MRALAAALLALHLAALSPGAAAAKERAGAAASSAIEPTLLTLEKQRSDAIVKADIATLRSLMDRYYRHVESRGRVRSKTELLTALERRELRFVSYENESTEVQVLDGGKVAVVAGVFRSRQESGKPFRGRYVRVWVRESNGWKNTFHQGTEIRPAPDDYNCK